MSICKRTFFTALLLIYSSLIWSQPTYHFRKYVLVGSLMNRTKPPYVIDLHKGAKHLVFIGCDHNRDTLHPQFAIIARYMELLKPQIAFNEGGQFEQETHYHSAGQGILAQGESGALKYWCDKYHAPMLNGDTPEREEFALMLKRYPMTDLYLYYVMERLVIPYLNGAYGSQPFEPLFDRAAKDWFVAGGFPLNAHQRTPDYFKLLYQKYTGRAFELKLNAQVERFDYVNGGDCRLCALGRQTKHLRDELLLDKIRKAFSNHDRILVTFGMGHALAMEPALRQLMSQL